MLFWCLCEDRRVRPWTKKRLLQQVCKDRWPSLASNVCAAIIKCLSPDSAPDADDHDDPMENADQVPVIRTSACGVWLLKLFRPGPFVLCLDT